MAGFLSPVRLFSFWRQDKPVASPLKAEQENPAIWHDAATGLACLRYVFGVHRQVCQLDLSGPDAQALQAVVALVINEVRRLEEKFSPYGPNSVIQALNDEAGRGAVAVDQETDQLLDLADQQWALSDGLVDVTAGLARYAWDDAHPDAPHNDAELQHLLTCMGWHHVRRQPGWVRFDHPALELNLGSLREAYAADRVVEQVAGAHPDVLIGLRVGHARRVAGPTRAHHAFPIPPLQTESLASLMQSWPMQAGGVVAKGFALDGAGAHPMAQLGFDPRTGRPLQAWKQVVVQAPTAVQADNWVNTALVKADGAIEWLNQRQACYFAVRRDGKLFCSQLDEAMLAAMTANYPAH